MFVLRRLTRIVRPVSILKKYLLTLTSTVFVAVMYFSLRVPVKIDCNVQCFDEVCHSLTQLGCPQKEAATLPKFEDPLPTRRPQMDFIEYLLSNSEDFDQEERLAFLADRGRHEVPAPVERLPFKKRHKPMGSIQPEMEINPATHTSSRSENLLPPAINDRTVTVLLNVDTGDEGTNLLEKTHLDIDTSMSSGDTSGEEINSAGIKSPPNVTKTSTSLSSNTMTISVNVGIPTINNISAPTSISSSETWHIETSKGEKPENDSSTQSNDSTSVEKQQISGRELLESYFEDERKKCSKQDATSEVDFTEYNTEEVGHPNSSRNNSWKFCPCIPPNLVGRLSTVVSSEFHLEDLWKSDHRDVELGGEWRPPNCRSRTRLAIIVPYRDRLDHLKVFLKHMLPILKRQLTHFRIFVVEQNEPAVFNKAAMMNIGFLEAMKQFNFDCVLFHDVDILMEDDRSLLNCGDTPHHYAISLDRWNYTLKYLTVFGAVISLRPKMFNKTNGFSNAYFGWGGEDDDMSRRVRRFWKIYRPPMEIGRYTALKHPRDAANKVNSNRLNVLKNQMKKMDKDGLNSVRYEVEKIEKLPLFTWILANLNVSRLRYPTHDASTYSLSDTICIDDEALAAPRQRSRITCQYDCDLEGPSCIGFNHRVDGFDRNCWLIMRNCSRVETVTHEQASSQTYLKKEKDPRFRSRLKALRQDRKVYRL